MKPSTPPAATEELFAPPLPEWEALPELVKTPLTQLLSQLILAHYQAQPSSRRPPHADPHH